FNHFFRHLVVALNAPLLSEISTSNHLAGGMLEAQVHARAHLTQINYFTKAIHHLVNKCYSRTMQFSETLIRRLSAPSEKLGFFAFPWLAFQNCISTPHASETTSAVPIGIVTALFTLLGIILKDLVSKLLEERRAEKRVKLAVYERYSTPLLTSAVSLMHR